MSLQGAIEHSQAQLEIFEEGLVRSQYAELLGLLRELQERRSAPLYSPVKPEDIANGWYWLVDPDGRESVCGILGATVFGYRPWNLHGLISEGYTFYRVPDMEVAE